jgi:hypothetical protein
MSRRSHAALAVPFWGALLVALAGCHLLNDRSTVGETRVGQGKVYHSDNPTYDEFFDGVHAVQAQSVDAVDEEAKARLPLEQALGTRNTTPDRLVELTRQRVKGGREGPPIHVAVAGLEPAKEGEPRKDVEAKVTVPDEAAIPPSQRDLVKALEQSMKSEAEILDRFGIVSDRAKRLQARQGQLVASLNRDFTTTSRREEVSHELGASKAILDEAAGRAEKASGQARSFLKGFSDAFTGNADAAAGKNEKPAPDKAALKPKNGAPPPKHVPPPKLPHKPPAEKPKAEPAPKPAAPNPAAPKPAPPPPAAPPPAAPPPKPAGEDFNP